MEIASTREREANDRLVTDLYRKWYGVNVNFLLSGYLAFSTHVVVRVDRNDVILEESRQIT